MKTAIIDLGSNTIRLVIYNIDGENMQSILNERIFAGVAEYIKDDILIDDGITKIILSLKKLYELGNLVGFDEIYCFATASLRNIQNMNYVKQKIENEVKFNIDILSEDDEINCDYIGLKRFVSDKNGIGLDLGGGSCQIFIFRDDEIKNSVSLPIGSLAIYNKFVKGLIPKKSEIKKIKKYVKENLYKLELDNTKFEYGYEYIHCMGGTARAAVKLYRAIIGGNKQISEYELSVSQINDMIKTIYKMDLNGIRLICHVIPERVYTIIPGLIVLKTICKYVGVKKIKVIKGSVREGYLWKRISVKDN